MVAHAVDLNTRHRFAIESQALDTALLAFSTQSKVQVLMWAGISPNVRSKGASGELSGAAALAAILDETGLTYRQVDEETVAIVPAEASVQPVSHRTDAGSIHLAQAEVASADTAEDGAEALTGISTVTITGSRIVRDGHEAPTPVTVVGEEVLRDAAKTNIAEALNEMPVFQNSSTPSSTTVSNSGQAGGNNLNLRNLGPTRTLVLFDGRRFPPAFVTGLVDLNLMPDALIDRVEVVTGGASAVYGSDALAGVVNLILNTDFTGFKASLEGGLADNRDGGEKKVSLTWGTAFAEGRGHFIVSGDWAKQSQVNGDHRDWNMRGYSLIQNPLYQPGNGQPQLITSLHVGLSAGYPGGIISGGPLRGTAFGPGGTPFQYDYGEFVTGAYNVGGDWAESSMMGAQSLIAGSDRKHLFLHGSFGLTDNVEVFAQFNHGDVDTTSRCCYPYYLGNLTVRTDNPFMPDSVREQAIALGLEDTPIPFGITLRNPPQGFGTVIGRKSDIFVLGLKGSLHTAATPWKWDLYAQRGKAKQNFWVPYQSNTERFMQAIDAVRDPDTGEIVCRSTLTNPNDGCVPYNVFGTDVVTQEMIDYTQGGPWLNQEIDQDLVGGSITGAPFSNWAGPVSLAASFEYRKDRIEGVNDPVSDHRGWFSTQLTAFNASQHVLEGALETVIPLAMDKRWARSLELNAGARATDYSTSGYVTTWKAGLTYEPIDDIRFRLTRSRDIRAPSLSDLFAQPRTNHNTIPDPFKGNQSFPYFQINVGNPDLKPEKADTLGIGVVLQPTRFPSFSSSIDYYRIDTHGVIDTVTYAYTLDQCFAGVQFYCNNITRLPNGNLDAITLKPENLSSLLAEGIDFEASYRQNLKDLVPSWSGTLTGRLIANHTIKLVTDSGIPGPTQVLDSAGAGSTPRWGLTGMLSYSLNGFRFSWTSRFLSKGKISETLIECLTDCPQLTGFRTVDRNRVPSYFISNMSTTYKFRLGPTDVEAFLSVQNVFDKDPPPYPNQIAGASYAITTNPALYDTLGRRLRIGFRLTM